MVSRNWKMVQFPDPEIAKMVFKSFMKLNFHHKQTKINISYYLNYKINIEDNNNNENIIIDNQTNLKNNWVVTSL